MRVPPCCGGKVVADAESEGAEEDRADAVSSSMCKKAKASGVSGNAIRVVVGVEVQLSSSSSMHSIRSQALLDPDTQ